MLLFVVGRLVFSRSPPNKGCPCFWDPTPRALVRTPFAMSMPDMMQRERVQWRLDAKSRMSSKPGLSMHPGLSMQPAERDLTSKREDRAKLVKLFADPTYCGGSLMMKHLRDSQQRKKLGIRQDDLDRLLLGGGDEENNWRQRRTP